MIFNFIKNIGRKWRGRDISANESESQERRQENTTIQNSTSTKNNNQAIIVTDIYHLSDYYGKFVKLTIGGLENPDTFILRNSIYSKPLSREEAQSILLTPLTELEYWTERGTFRVKIEPVFDITAKEYEDNHYIYGILRRKPGEDYVLTNAFIAPTEKSVQIKNKALKSQETFEYSVLDDGTISVFNFTSDPVENLEIPSKIDGKVVTSISRNAFENNKTIKSLKVPDTVKTINYGAFSCCDSLQSVFLGEGVEVLDGAFAVCKKLEKVYVGKSVSEINDSFSNCHKILSFEVNPANEYFCTIDGVLFSKDKTVLIFCPCGKKGKYIIPYGTEVIGESAFENTELEEVVISDTVKKIECNAFAWAYSIKRLTISSSVEDIGYNAISAGVGDFEGEIIIEYGSYAQRYFADFYDNEYNLVIKDESSLNEATATTPINNSEKLFCRRCGAQLPLDSDFCFKCGTKVKNITE